MASFDAKPVSPEKPESVGKPKDGTNAFQGVHEELSSRPDKKVAQAQSAADDILGGKTEQQWVDASRKGTREQLFPDGKGNDASSADVFKAMGKQSFDGLNELDKKIKDATNNHLSKQDIDGLKAERAYDLHELHLTDAHGNLKQKLTPDVLTDALIKNMAEREHTSMQGFEQLTGKEKEAKLKSIEDGAYRKFYKDVKNGVPLPIDKD